MRREQHRRAQKGRAVNTDLEPQAAARAAAELGARLDTATKNLLQTASGLTDEQARAASLLPGWSRGHVLTHLARSADGLRNLLIWARTGVETPQYPNVEVRNADIEAGSGRPAADLAADVAEAAAGFAAEAATLRGAEWVAEVRGIRGAPHPAWYTLFRRLCEVEVHHVDLAAGYRPADWPAEFAAECLQRVAGDFTGQDSPAALLRATDSGAQHRIGPAATTTALTITGPQRDLLAWLIGRSGGAGLTADPPGPLPSPPPW